MSSRGRLSILREQLNTQKKLGELKKTEGTSVE